MNIQEITYTARELYPTFVDRLHELEQAGQLDDEYNAVKKAVDVCKVLSSFNYDKHPTELTILRQCLKVVEELKKGRKNLVPNYAFAAFYELSNVLPRKAVATQQYYYSFNVVNSKYSKLKKLNEMSRTKGRQMVYSSNNKAS